MFLAQAYNYLHDAWRYFLGAVLVFFGAQLIGILPFFGFAAAKLISEGRDLSELGDPNGMMTILDSNLTLFLMLLSFAIGLFFLFLWIRMVHKQPVLTVTTSRKKMDWGRFWFGFGLVAVSTIVLTYIDNRTNPDDYVLQFQLVPFLILALVAVVMIPLQTSFEEYLFRGYLMQGIGVNAGNKWLPLIITSVIFGGLHILNPEVEKLGYIIMFYYIGTGFFLGIMTLMDEGMELALGFHAGNNLVAALLVTADWTVFQTNSILKDVSEPSAGIDILLPLVIVYPLFLGLMAWRYKWSDWKEKLTGKVVRPAAIEDEWPAGGHE
ncbi:CPBP family intramembrane glutamic endopeptidase [Aureitalea marina]|uniref:Abortive phage infection protein n=1 Tax=Aureitalea marina TaxID=930804 RepID=A0A2S7KN69_9FLAO|nr:CPBP family intramembrane glutamic endopeptidase [Aureitalea marina]PQB04079.1 abortive phage infection protein [Aureitalea marina]